tara:strand:+ start:3454 stop:3588 length:135 start_codon:yes stop_codon:yes gene_type:complete
MARTILNELRRACTPELYEQECDIVCQQIYNGYLKEEWSIYTVG